MRLFLDFVQLPSVTNDRGILGRLFVNINHSGIPGLDATLNKYPKFGNNCRQIKLCNRHKVIFMLYIKYFMSNAKQENKTYVIVESGI